MPKVKLDPSFIKEVQNLNKAAEEASETIKNLDQQLADAGVGVEVWLPLWEEKFLEEASEEDVRRGHEEPRGMVRVTQIGYGRIGNRFMLAVREKEGEDFGYDTDHYESKRYPLAGASRELRLDSEPKLADLVKAIENAVKARLEKRREPKK